MPKSSNSSNNSTNTKKKLRATTAQPARTGPLTNNLIMEETTTSKYPKLEKIQHTSTASHNQQTRPSKRPATILDSLIESTTLNQKQQQQHQTKTPNGKTQCFKTLVANLRRNTWRDDIMVFKLNNKTKQHQKTHGCVASSTTTFYQYRMRRDWGEAGKLSERTGESSCLGDIGDEEEMDGGTDRI
jgi:hypothetical protein